MNNCPWCGAEERLFNLRSPVFACGSWESLNDAPFQSDQCRIRQLEAELRLASALVKLASRIGEVDVDFDALALAKCREYAQAKEKTDEPAN